MKKNCLIVGAGEYVPFKNSVENYDYIIAADGGYARLKKETIAPDIILGDFDSLGFLPEDKNKIIYPSEKNEADMQIAIELAYENGCKKIDIYGGTGGRFDHTIANLQLLKYLAEKDVENNLFGKNFTATAIKNDKVTFNAKDKGYISVFSLTEISTGVFIKGLKYNLYDSVLKSDTPLGVSNEFIGHPAEISVKNGILLIIDSSLD